MTQTVLIQSLVQSHQLAAAEVDTAIAPEVGSGGSGGGGGGGGTGQAEVEILHQFLHLKVVMAA